MPRPRINKEDNWLPDRVYRGKSSYEYRPKGSKMVTLCRLVREEGKIVEPPAVKKRVLEAFETAILIKAADKNIDYWLPKFLVSNRFLRLSRRTQQDYTRYCNAKADPSNPESRNGVRVVFGKMMPHKVKTHHIRRYMDYWAAVGKKTTANRHLSFLQTFFGWIREQNAGVELNPAHGVTKFKETPRQVYITDEQYTRTLEAATKSKTPYVAAIMEFAYLCGLRKHEVLRLNVTDITPKGVLIVRGKGSKGEYTKISPRLQQAIGVAMSINHDRVEPLKDRPLFRSLKRTRVSRSALEKAWRKIRIEAGVPDFWIHDLKKKAGSDGKDLGHKTQAMKELYDLSIKVKSATR